MGRRFVGSIDQLKSGNWRIRYRVNGERFQETGFDSEKDAERALTRIRADIDSGRWWDESKGDVLFKDFAVEYLEQRKEELAPGTYRNYETLIRKQLNPTFGDIPVRAISVRTVDKWWTSKSDHPVNRRNAYFLLSSMFKLALAWEYTRQSPCVRPNAGKDVAAPRPTFTRADFLAVLEKMPDELHTPLWVLFNASLRLGELCGLKYMDYNDTTGTLTVRRQLSAVTGEFAQTKTGDEKAAPLFGEALARMNAHVKGNRNFPIARLFYFRGKPITAKVIRTEWNKARVAAGRPEMHLHDLRHISLTEWARIPGVTLKDIKARGAHRSDTSALRYQHTDDVRALELARMAGRVYG